MEEHKCAVCEKTFSKSSNLYYSHLRNIHKEEPVFPKFKIICPVCQADFVSKVKYEEHLQTAHKLKIVNLSFTLVP